MANKRLIGGSVVATSMAIAFAFITQREGLSLTAYLDTAGIYTYCYGEAYVKPGATATKEECQKLAATTIGKHMDQVLSVVKVPLSAETLAAHTSFHYNVGASAYNRSSTLRLTNQGDLAEGCSKMLLWKISGKKDCSIKSNGCYGLWLRRKDEVKLCIQGLNK